MSGRIRSLKPEWLEDEALLRSSSDARVASIALLLLADDYGNGRGSDMYLGAQIFPGEALAKIREALARLVAIRYVGFYEADGQRYFAIRNWDKHQKVDRPGKPRVPKPLGDFRESLAKIPVTLATDPDPDPDPDPDLIPRPTTTLTQVVQTKRAPRNRSPGAAPTGVAIVRGLWLKCYEATYGKPGRWGAREGGQCQMLLGTWTVEDLVELVPRYFAWKRPEVIRSGHPFGVGIWSFTMRMHELRADVIAPERRVIAAQAQDHEQTANRKAAGLGQAERMMQRFGVPHDQSATETTRPGAIQRLEPPADVAVRDAQQETLGRRHGPVD